MTKYLKTLTANRAKTLLMQVKIDRAVVRIHELRLKRLIKILTQRICPQCRKPDKKFMLGFKICNECHFENLILRDQLKRSKKSQGSMI